MAAWAARHQRRLAHRARSDKGRAGRPAGAGRRTGLPSSAWRLPWHQPHACVFACVESGARQLPGQAPRLPRPWQCLQPRRPTARHLPEPTAGKHWPPPARLHSCSLCRGSSFRSCRRGRQECAVSVTMARARRHRHPARLLCRRSKHLPRLAGNRCCGRRRPLLPAYQLVKFRSMGTDGKFAGVGWSGMPLSM